VESSVAPPSPVVAVEVSAAGAVATVIVDGISDGSAAHVVDGDDDDATSERGTKAGTGLGSTDGQTVSATATRSRARWHLAYTLLNNPSLIPLRGSPGNVGR
jgi:hypothetical protein